MIAKEFREGRMKNRHLYKVKELLEQARPKLPTTHQLSFKNVFGAVAGYVNGHIFISCGTFGVALKLPPEVLDDLFKDKGAKHLKYFPRGHVKNEYAVLPKRIVEDERRFRELVDRSIGYALRETFGKSGAGGRT